MPVTTTKAHGSPGLRCPFCTFWFTPPLRKRGRRKDGNRRRAQLRRHDVFPHIRRCATTRNERWVYPLLGQRTLTIRQTIARIAATIQLRQAAEAHNQPREEKTP